MPSGFPWDKRASFFSKSLKVGTLPKTTESSLNNWVPLHVSIDLYGFALVQLSQKCRGFTAIRPKPLRLPLKTATVCATHATHKCRRSDAEVNPPNEEGWTSTTSTSRGSNSIPNRPSKPPVEGNLTAFGSTTSTGRKESFAGFNSPGTDGLVNSQNCQRHGANWSGEIRETQHSSFSRCPSKAGTNER